MLDHLLPAAQVAPPGRLDLLGLAAGRYDRAESSPPHCASQTGDQHLRSSLAPGSGRARPSARAAPSVLGKPLCTRADRGTSGQCARTRAPAPACAHTAQRCLCRRALDGQPAEAVEAHRHATVEVRRTATGDTPQRDALTKDLSTDRREPRRRSSVHDERQLQAEPVDAAAWVVVPLYAEEAALRAEFVDEQRVDDPVENSCFDVPKRLAVRLRSLPRVPAQEPGQLTRPRLSSAEASTSGRGSPAPALGAEFQPPLRTRRAERQLPFVGAALQPATVTTSACAGDCRTVHAFLSHRTPAAVSPPASPRSPRNTWGNGQCLGNTSAGLDNFPLLLEFPTILHRVARALFGVAVAPCRRGLDIRMFLMRVTPTGVGRVHRGQCQDGSIPAHSCREPEPPVVELHRLLRSSGQNHDTAAGHLMLGRIAHRPVHTDARMCAELCTTGCGASCGNYQQLATTGRDHLPQLATI